jgi:hypothetical protein
MDEFNETFGKVFNALEDGRTAELEEWDNKIAIKLFDDRRYEGARFDETISKRIFIINIPHGNERDKVFWNPTQREMMSKKWKIN